MTRCTGIGRVRMHCDLYLYRRAVRSCRVTTVAADVPMFGVLKIETNIGRAGREPLWPALLMTGRTRPDVAFADNLVLRMTLETRRMSTGTCGNRHTFAGRLVAGRASGLFEMCGMFDLRRKTSDRRKVLQFRGPFCGMADSTDRMFIVSELWCMTARTRRMRRELGTLGRILLLMA